MTETNVLILEQAEHVVVPSAAVSLSAHTNQ